MLWKLTFIEIHVNDNKLVIDLHRLMYEHEPMLIICDSNLTHNLQQGLAGQER